VTSGPNVHSSFEKLFEDTRTRLTLVERRIAVRGGGGATMRGTTAQRDTAYGVPSTDAERVALANMRVTWFNTDRGWVESFYMTADSGLTATALLAGYPPGWYPMPGSAIFAHRGRSSGPQAIPANTYTLATLNTATILQGGATASGQGIVAPIGGHYRLTGGVYHYSGAASMVQARIMINSTFLTHTEDYRTASAVSLFTGGVRSLSANDVLTVEALAVIAGNIGGSTGYGTYVEFEYMSPPLVSN
jgi:hypothetical protein